MEFGRSQCLCFADEMRLGLHSQVRRVWFPRGVKLRQKQQMRFEWRWLYLGVECASGRLLWQWREKLNKEQAESVLRGWRSDAGVEAVIWDNAPSHKAKLLKQLGDAAPRLAFLPPYSPELNPAERVFEEVRRHTEGKLYDSIEAKQEQAEVFLSSLAADPEQVRRLTGWQWIAESINSLPERNENVAST